MQTEDERSGGDAQIHKCSNLGCDFKGNGSALSRHQAKCQHLMVHCRYYLYGCHHKCKSLAVKEHEASCRYMTRSVQALRIRSDSSPSPVEKSPHSPSPLPSEAIIEKQESKIRSLTTYIRDVLDKDVAAMQETITKLTAIVDTTNQSMKKMEKFVTEKQNEMEKSIHDKQVYQTNWNEKISKSLEKTQKLTEKTDKDLATTKEQFSDQLKKAQDKFTEDLKKATANVLLEVKKSGETLSTEIKKSNEALSTEIKTLGTSMEEKFQQHEESIQKNAKSLEQANESITKTTQDLENLSASCDTRFKECCAELEKLKTELENTKTEIKKWATDELDEQKDALNTIKASLLFKTSSGLSSTKKELSKVIQEEKAATQKTIRELRDELTTDIMFKTQDEIQRRQQEIMTAHETQITILRDEFDRFKRQDTRAIVQAAKTPNETVTDPLLNAQIEVFNKISSSFDNASNSGTTPEKIMQSVLMIVSEVISKDTKETRELLNKVRQDFLQLDLTALRRDSVSNTKDIMKIIEDVDVLRDQIANIQR
jgi:DNA repair exonuclease SbcCD ATPase subunit